MTTWDVDIRLGWVVGLGMVAALLAATVGLVTVAAVHPVSIITFLAAMGAVATFCGSLYIGYRLWGLIHATYEMDRNVIVIHWGDTHHQIPMVSVQQVLPGTEVANVRLRRGIRWPGYKVGYGESPALGPVLFYATASPDRQVVIRTTGVTYVLSPRELEPFLTALGERLEMGPTQEVEERSIYPAFLDWAIWRDRWAVGALAVNVGLLLLLVALLCWQYPALPDRIAMRFDAKGEPLLIVDAARIFYLAMMGGIFLLINGTAGLAFYKRRKVVAYMLWSGLTLMLTGLWGAAVVVLTKQP